MSLLFNKLSRLVITFLPRSKHLIISRLNLSSAVILEPPKIKFWHYLPIHSIPLGKGSVSLNCPSLFRGQLQDQTVPMVLTHCLQIDVPTTPSLGWMICQKAGRTQEMQAKSHSSGIFMEVWLNINSISSPFLLGRIEDGAQTSKLLIMAWFFWYKQHSLGAHSDSLH